MGFWVTLGIYLFTTLLSTVLRGRSRFGQKRAPSSLGEFQQPTADEGRAIPALFGTALLEGPNVLWSGDYLATPILEDGVTVAWRHHLGVAYGLCMGPIDRVIDVRFDRKVISQGEATLVAGQVLVVDAGAGADAVALPNGTFPNAGELARAATGAIHAQTADTLSRIVYGYQVIPGWSDVVHFRLGGGGSLPRDYTVELREGYYDGPGIAAELTDQVRLAFSVGVNRLLTWTHNPSNDKLSVETSAFLAASFTVYGDSTVLALLGFPEGVDLVLGPGDTETAPAATFANRYFFAVRGGTDFLWEDASTNCHALFGQDPGATNTTTPEAADVDRLAGQPAAKFTDFDGGTRLTIDARELFGGDRDEGGIAGVFDVYHGGDTQGPDPYLEARYGVTAPAWRGLCYAVARRPYWGTSPYLKNVAFVLERCPNALGLAAGRHRIPVSGASGDDANAAAVLHELLVDARWGLAIPEALLDLASFRAVGDQLAAEGLGVSLAIDAPTEGLDLVQEVTRLIDAVLFVDPSTGLLTLSLVRPDWTFDALPRYGPGVVSWVRMSRPAWTESKSSVKVEVIDRAAGHTPRVVQIQDLANVQMLGRVEVEEAAFRGLTSVETGQAAAERLLRSVAQPLARGEARLDRAARGIRPGAAFVLDWPPAGISGMVVRATRVRHGEVDDGAIEAEFVEDPYGLHLTTYGAPY